MHDLRLAFASLKRNPILSGLMIAAIAVGIAALMIAITLYHARAGHPIPWKSDKLFAVTLDTRDNDPDRFFSRHPEYPPWQLTYRDARYLYSSSVPVRAVMMFKSGGVVTPERASVKPFRAIVRVTTADFFTMFDVPFAYGGSWARADDEAPGPVVVLSRFMNEKLFAGENSVGRQVTFNGKPYKVIGVLAAWMPRPKYYDLNNFGFDVPEDIFMPFGWMQASRMGSWGNTNCVSKRAKLTGFDSLLTEDCTWLQYWVELRNAEDRVRYQSFVDNYANEERKHGRFPRPQNNNRVVNVQTWLDMWDIVGDDSRMQVVLGFVFLAVCVLNTLGLMLAKFLSAAPISGLRRALGASRADIMRQHLIEVIVVGLLGGLAGLLLTLGGLGVLQGLLFSSILAGSDNPDKVAMVQSFVHMDIPVITAAIGLSLITGVLAGLYPAWRIGRLAPATFLKTQ
jgi:putative ABC transport system permease protein